MKSWLLFSAVLAISILANLSVSSSYALIQSYSSGILSIAYPVAMTKLQEYVTTDKPYYVLGMEESKIVHISGRLSAAQPSVLITVKTPYNEYTRITWNTDPMGYFSVPYLIDFNAPAGQYDVIVYYNEGQVSTSFYVTRA